MLQFHLSNIGAKWLSIEFWIVFLKRNILRKIFERFRISSNFLNAFLLETKVLGIVWRFLFLNKTNATWFQSLKRIFILNFILFWPECWFFLFINCFTPLWNLPSKSKTSLSIWLFKFRLKVSLISSSDNVSRCS